MVPKWASKSRPVSDPQSRDVQSARSWVMDVAGVVAQSFLLNRSTGEGCSHGGPRVYIAFASDLCSVFGGIAVCTSGENIGKRCVGVWFVCPGAAGSIRVEPILVARSTCSLLCGRGCTESGQC